MDNQRLLQQYVCALDSAYALRRDNEPIPVLRACRAEPARFELNEHFLFHGATAPVVQEICQGGFDHRRGGENAGKMFGVAAYFTQVASKADMYTEDLQNRQPRTAQRQMIIARAVLGTPYYAPTPMPGLTRPPDGPDGRPFDSVIAVERKDGGSVDHTEVMIYTLNQALPLAVVTYSHDPSCACAECKKRPIKSN